MVICAHIFQIGLNILKINYEKIEENDGDIDDEHPTLIGQKSSHKPLANLKNGDYSTTNEIQVLAFIIVT